MAQTIFIGMIYFLRNPNNNATGMKNVLASITVNIAIPEVSNMLEGT